MAPRHALLLAGLAAISGGAQAQDCPCDNPQMPCALTGHNTCQSYMVSQAQADQRGWPSRCGSPSMAMDCSGAQAQDIVTLAQSVDALSTLVTAVIAGGLVPTLQSPGPFTVFAPTNDAFAALGQSTINALLADHDRLVDVLTYHVLPVEVHSTDLSDGQRATTVEGGDLTVRIQRGTVSIVGAGSTARVVQADVQASNGVVHVIDTVLLPPAEGGTPAPAPSCTSNAQLQAFLTPINEHCCQGAGDDCSSGVPATCSANCASVLLPFSSACASVLSQPAWSGIEGPVSAAVATCAESNAPPGPCSPNPCQNGAVCSTSRPPKGGGGGGHRRTQGAGYYRCACRPGFTGSDCQSGTAVASASPLIIKGVFDMDIPGGKAVQLMATQAILSLGSFAIGVASNGHGTDGAEVVLPAVPLMAGQSFWLVRDISAFSTYMGMNFGVENINWMSDNHLTQNGDDTVELFSVSGSGDFELVTLVDVYGDANVDGTGEAWEYKDAWARRNDRVQSGNAVFDVSEWEVAPSQCTDDAVLNSQSTCPYSCGPQRQGECPGYTIPPPPPGTCIPGTGTASVGGNSDASEEAVASGAVDTSSSDLELTHEGDSEQVVAIRFPSVSIAAGVQISSSSILFDVDEVRPGQSDVDTTIAIYGEQSANSAVLSSTAVDISSRRPTRASVRWNPEPSVTTHDDLVTPDLSSILNEVVSQPGWATGNPLTIMMGHIDGAGSRWVESHRTNNGVDTPALRWTTACTPGGGKPASGTATSGPVIDAVFTVRSRDDDAEEAVSSGSVSTSSSDLELMNEGSDDAEQVVLLVFPAVTVPAGATVIHAQVLFDIDEVKPGQSDVDTTITISGQVGHAMIPTAADHDISSRPLTRASIIWQPEPSINVHDDLTTPDIADIANEIVNGAGWSLGSNLGLLFGHVSGSGIRWVESYRSAQDVVTPALRVSYSGGESASWTSPLYIKGVLDLDITHSDGKAVQLMALRDIQDLSSFGIGVENSHGGGGDIEMVLPATSLRAGETFWCLTRAASADIFAVYMGIDVGQVRLGLI